jgi:hypothetical protein
VVLPVLLPRQFTAIIYQDNFKAMAHLAKLMFRLNIEVANVQNNTVLNFHDNYCGNIIL